MNEKQFIELLTGVKDQMLHDEDCSKRLEKVFPESFCLYYDTSLVIDKVLAFVKEVMGDKDEWVEYFIYELKWGRKYEEGCVTENDESTSLKSLSDLYKLLEKNKFPSLVNKEITLTKIEDKRFEGQHPNGINKGDTLRGYLLDEIRVGEQVELYIPFASMKNLTGWTSKVVSFDQEKMIIQTLNSTYKIEINE